MWDFRLKIMAQNKLYYWPLLTTLTSLRSLDISWNFLTIWANFIIIFFNLCGPGVELSPLILLPFIALVYPPGMTDGDDCGAISRVNEWQVKPKFSEKFCHGTALPTADGTWFNRARTQAVAVGNRRQTTWDMTRSNWATDIVLKGCCSWIYL
jgi:hypothetical protein